MTSTLRHWMPATLALLFAAQALGNEARPGTVEQDASPAPVDVPDGGDDANLVVTPENAADPSAAADGSLDMASLQEEFDAWVAGLDASSGDAALDEESAESVRRGAPTGTHSAGRLIEGIPFPTDDARFHVLAPHRAFATERLIDGLRDAVDQVEGQFPGTPALTVGDVSTARGGRLSPHMSHQNGLDVDIGPFWKNGEVQPLRSMRPETLDMERTWELLEAFVGDEQVQYIILDYRLQKVFYEYARKLPWMDDEYLELIFQYPRGPRHHEGIIRHWEGHYSHFHVRYYCPPEFADSCSPAAP